MSTGSPQLDGILMGAAMYVASQTGTDPERARDLLNGRPGLRLIDAPDDPRAYQSIRDVIAEIEGAKK